MRKNKNISIILSILIAVGLWVYVIIEENPTVTQKYENIPVTILNEESLAQRGLTLLTEQAPTVTVSLEGQKAEINKITRDDIVVSVDVFGYSKGENHIPVNVQAPESVSIADVKSSKVVLHIDELVSVAKNINVVATGSLPKDRELGELTVKPQEVMISGAKTVVDTISVVEAYVDFAKFGEQMTTVTAEINIKDVNDMDVVGVKPSATTTEISAQKLFVKEVPLSMEVLGEVDPLYAVTSLIVPEKVLIKGTEEALAAIEAVSAAAVEISTLTETTRIPIEVDLPEGVTLSSVTASPVVSVVIKSVLETTVTLDSSDMKFFGLTEGLAATAEHIMIEAVVEGPESVINNVTEKDFILSADLAGLSKGRHEVPLLVEYTKDFKNVKLEPTEILVTINEAY